MKKLMTMVALLGLVTLSYAVTTTNKLGQVITDYTLEESLTNEAYATPQQVDQSDYAKFPNRLGYFYRTYDSALNGGIADTTVVLNASFDAIPSNAIPLDIVIDVWKPQTPGTNGIALGFGGSSGILSSATTNFVDTAVRIVRCSSLSLTNDLDVTMTVVGSVTQIGFNVYGTYFIGN